MINKKLLIAASGVIIILVIVLAGGTDREQYSQTFEIDAVYDDGLIRIDFLDRSQKTTHIVMEILGLEESFHKEISGHNFTEFVPFDGTPKYGWAVHPVILDIRHQEFGSLQIKTEIHPKGQPARPVIYSAR